MASKYVGVDSTIKQDYGHSNKPAPPTSKTTTQTKAGA
jgi:hypothetical protein